MPENKQLTGRDEGKKPRKNLDTRRSEFTAAASLKKERKKEKHVHKRIITMQQTLQTNLYIYNCIYMSIFKD